MKRFLLAAAFFAVLVLLWEVAYRAKIWSPVLLPSPRQVVNYLEGAVADGTLVKATVITMRRLARRLFDRNGRRTAARSPDRAMETFA